MDNVIIICEPEAIIAEDLREGLMEYQYIPIACNDLMQLKTVMELVRPNLMLIETSFDSHLDGIAAVREIRRNDDYPVIFLTNDSSTQTIQEAAASNCDGYLIKPISLIQLRAALEITIQRHRTEKLRMFSRLPKCNRDFGCEVPANACCGYDTEPTVYLPVCSSCNRIRNGNGDWYSIEQFLSRYGTLCAYEHCPDCEKHRTK